MEHTNEFESSNYYKQLKSRTKQPARQLRKVYFPPDSTSPVLTPEMISMVLDTSKNPSSAHVHADEAHSNLSTTITIEDLNNFDERTWIDDKVLYFYLEMIRARNNAPGSGLSSVYAFQPSFYMLYSMDPDAVENTTFPDNIFAFKYIFFPILKGKHWILICADTDKKTLVAFDPKKKNDNCEPLGVIEKYLKEEYERLQAADGDADAGTTKPAASDYFHGWQFQMSQDVRIPQQSNNYDCGLFVLQFADYIARGQPFNFQQKHMGYFRQRMAYEVIQGKLLPQLEDSQPEPQPSSS